VKIEAEFSEANFKKNQQLYHEVPLYQLKEQYTSAAGKEFVQKIVNSQTGKPHPQFRNDPECKLYRVFIRNESKDGATSASTSRIVAEGGELTRTFYLGDIIPL